MLTNLLTKLLKIDYPIIQAPMAGGITTSKLVAAVSNNGALGMIGAGYLSPTQLQEQIREVKELTSKSFGVNLFVPNDFQVTEDEIDVASKLLHKFQAQLNIENEQSVIPNKDDAFEVYNEQIKVIMEEKVPICSFTFGVPSVEIISQLKQHGIILIGTATSVVEAKAIEKLGMHAVVVQGSEAGGHRGNFISNHEESLVGLMSLIPQVSDHVSIPVIAAGGIMDGRGLLASLYLGAKAVQMGTAFLTCEESGAHPVHKEAILQAKDEDIIFTRAFSGKWARGIQNKFTTEMQKHEADILPFPVQNTFTQSIRKASSSQNNKDFMSLWSGQSPTLAKNETVEMLIQRIIKRAEKG
ncbi:nitronate monooxygenase [Psychrobacillus sp. NEAU-3TGS]|uniref:NAD(P)H-dependent flavin oxidoreductase n=1 Tax=Psychrobacillus sp. NEAU-3TGS TaxID=2995412 RepID=UPI002495A8A9|nr:nitronate monooxygenase [Psychrobacillus sp. NEAU-3TGS]MDI2588318.1 nitronate monooxygenase [Psychrobacillus sp. NEAU-3TGS]